MGANSPSAFFELARMMIKQARLLRDAGQRFEARALARRALAMNTAAWRSRRMLLTQI